MVIFDENEDLDSVFQSALAESEATGKKILVEYGGDWCVWSRRMAKVLMRPEFSSLIEQRFVYVRCFVGPSEDLPDVGVEFPSFDSVPYFSLMDSDGNILATQATEEFELLWFYRKGKVHAFLKEWAIL